MSLDLQARLFEERSAADLSAQKLAPDQHARWNACRSSHRFMSFSGKQLVAYRLLFLRPEVTDIFTCRGLDVALSTGLSSLWESRNTKQQFWVSSTPKEIASGCFLWMLKYSSLEYVDYQDGKRLMFSLAYRVNRNPKDMVDGTTYLLEKSVFDNTHFEG